MKLPFLKIVNFVLSVAIFTLICLNNSHACDSPDFKKTVSLEEISGLNFQINWNPVSNANDYELKYIIRIPDGRTLMQREVVATQPFYIFSTGELPKGDFLQLIVELGARCDATKSTPVFAQIALKNLDAGCSFEKQIPSLKNEILSWVPIKAAQSYLMCFFKDQHQVSCQETISPQNKIVLDNTSMIGVTPVCDSVAGTPVYISVVKNL